MRSSWSARCALTALFVTIASSICASAEAACGDALVDVGETCDDSNLVARDGCSASCQIEAGYVCSGAPSTCCFQDAAAAYALLADATYASDLGIITLTPEGSWKDGVAWYRRALDFTAPFSISVRFYLGTRDSTPTASMPDSGADGTALLFQRDPRGLSAKGIYAGSAGEDGGELGAKGIAPVVGVELDTYDNGPSFGDTTAGDEDHTSVFRGGTHPETNQLTPATCMNPGALCSNFEDGTWHRLDVSWSGELDHHLGVFIDGEQRIDLASDLVADYFQGEPKGITFGLAASTGGYFNVHRFCPLAPYGFSVPRDRDQDGVDDSVDVDSDGDGASDAAETASAFGSSDPDADRDGDSVPDYRDADTWKDVLARAGDCPDVVAPFGACDSLIAALDFDRDGIADHLDLDADADGTPDASDTAPRDPCKPALSAACPMSAMPDAGIADASVPPVTMDDAGRPTAEGPTPGDLDGDRVANELDSAPNDPCIPSRNVLACGAGDFDGDRLNNEFECPGLRMCRDTDSDGVSDYADADSDGDGLSDATECPNMGACPDADKDGLPDLLSPALVKTDDGCALAHSEPLSALWLALLLFSARTGSFARSAIARACAARRSLPWSRAARRRPRATPRSS